MLTRLIEFSLHNRFLVLAITAVVSLLGLAAAFNLPIDAAICDGDYVVIRSQKDCNKGEIVAAMIDGEATVKTFTKKDGHIWLMPANDDYKPINGDEAEILGIVTAVLRSL